MWLHGGKPNLLNIYCYNKHTFIYKMSHLSVLYNVKKRTSKETEIICLLVLAHFSSQVLSFK